MCAGWGLLLLLALPLHARPQVLIVLADHLTLADVTRPDLPGLARMRREGEIALMSPGLAQKPDPVANVYATLGAGDTVRVGDISQGRMADVLRRAGVRMALLGDVGPGQPTSLLLPTPDVMSDTGEVTNPPRLWAATQAAFRSCDLVVVRLGPAQALDEYISVALSEHHGPLFVVVPTPPSLRNGTWNRLTPFLGAGDGHHAHLTSDTTQTLDLIASRDIAPTILKALNVPAPLQMTGAPARPAAPLYPADLSRMDRLTRLNQEAQNPIFWAVGLGAATIVFGSLGLYLAGHMAGLPGKAARYGLRAVSAWPLALLLAPLADPHRVSVYIALFAGLTALLALLPSPPLICALTALVIIGDGLTGTMLISNSALSEYALAGIRFYGIGNEYMGVLIGGALLACALGTPTPRPFLDPASALTPLSRLRPLVGTERGQGRSGGWGLAFWFALAVFVLSFPSFGAKAGGAVTAMATFVTAWRRIRKEPVNWMHLAGSIAAGFVLVFVWALLSHALHLRRTHLETAVGALGQGRFGYIAGVSLRKIGLAARVALHPGTLLGLMAFGLLWLAARRFLWKAIVAHLSRHPRFDAVWGAGLWGCLVAVLFNDSGIVAAILMLQCLALSLLHGLFLEEKDAPARA